MHVGIVCFDAFGEGAVPQRAFREAEALCGKGHSVTVFTNQHPPSDRYPFAVTVVPRWNVPGPFRAVIWEFSFGLFLRSALTHRHAANPLSVVAVYGSSPGLATAAFQRSAGVPWVFVMLACIFDKLAPTANPYGRPLTLLYRYTNRFSCQRSARVVAVSDDMRRWAEYCGCPPGRVVVIPNAVPANFEAGHGADAPVASTPYILYVGRLSPEKGVDVLLQAFAYVAGENKQVHLHVIGGGDLQGMTEKARGLGINGRVTFHGGLPHSVLPGWYRGAMLSAMPSRADAQPLTVLEAMASRCPVVASCVGGIPEMVKEGESGLLVRPDSPLELAAAIVRVLGDQSLRERLKLGGSRTALRFSFEYLFEKTLSLYHELAQMPVAT